jgi:Tfp pilus assembly protein PilE
MKNKQAGFIGIAIVAVVAVLGLAAIGGWVYVEKSKTSGAKTEVTSETSDQNQVQNNSGTQQAVNTEARIEFPWGNYNKTVNARATDNNSKLVGQTINIGGLSKATLVVGESINVGGGSKIGTMYVFKGITIAADSKVDVLYVESATSLTIGRNVTIGKKVVLSHNDLVNKAKTTVGIGATTSSGSTTSSSGTTNVSNTTTASPAPTTQTNVTVSYTGSWNGTFTANAIAASQGCPGGEVAFNVLSDGTFQGPVTIKGAVYYGGGNVDKNGKMSGGWNLSGSKISLTGQLGASTGSGSYVDQGSGCFGNFSVSK